jgi:ABC-2 type transport system permease protein
MALNLSGGYRNFEYALNNAQMILIILIPVLTMRILSGERSQKTDQLLYGSVESMTKIVLGKYLAALTVYTVPIMIFASYPLLLGSFGTVNYWSAYTCLLALYLLGIALISIGIFISSLSTSQSVTAVVSFVVLLISYMIPTLVGYISSEPSTSLLGFLLLLALICCVFYHVSRNSFLPICIFGIGGIVMTVVYIIAPGAYQGALKDFLSVFALFDRYELFVYGMVKIHSLLIFLLTGALFLFLSIQSMEIRRWH